MKEIALLGSTGSIGTQTLEVIRLHRERWHVFALTAHKNIELLAKQAEEFQPKLIVVTDEKAGRTFQKTYQGTAKVVVGEEGLCEVVSAPAVEICVIAVVGIAGLRPTLAALEAGKEVALANKETLVAGGELVMQRAKEKQRLIRPIDSEHSAIFQSMLGQDPKGIHKIILTASGGPFRGKSIEELQKVTVEEAMKHPVWNMGMKVTLDSATLFNKGLEVIEAHHLFHVPYDDIEVVVQPQSLIHSMVEYDDGSIMAQIGEPDMRLPIQFALTCPERLETPSHSFLDWKQIASIQIEQPNRAVFRSLDLAYFAGKQGGDMTTAFNAANEEAIRGFIEGRIRFLDIFDVVEKVLMHRQAHPVYEINHILEADKEARGAAQKYMETLQIC